MCVCARVCECVSGYADSQHHPLWEDDISSKNTNLGAVVWAGMKKKRRSAIAVTMPGRQVQNQGRPWKSNTPPSPGRQVPWAKRSLFSLSGSGILFPFQPRNLSSRPVAIGRVMWPRVVLARFSFPLEPPLVLSQDVACPAPGTQVSKLGTRAPQRKTVVVCHDSPLHPLTLACGQESDARPENCQCMHVTALLEISSGKGLWSKSMASSEIFWSMWQARFAVAPKV